VTGQSRKVLEIEALFQKDRQLVYVMSYGESNDHLLDDVTCLIFLFGTDYILSLHFQNR